jgi:hypothetical protein
MTPNQFILEAKYLDKIKRVKRKTIVGVFPSLESIEPVKEKLTSEESKYTVIFSITSRYDPFLIKIA